MRVRIKGYDSRVVEKSAKIILETAYNTGSKVMGPIFLPSRRSVFCVLRSPHIEKRSMEHFERVIHLRIVDISDPTAQTVDALQHLELPSGVDIEVRSIMQ